jgi:hypothetical protein
LSPLLLSTSNTPSILPDTVEFYPSLGNLLGTAKGEEAATTEAILAFVLSMLTKMGAR